PGPRRGAPRPFALPASLNAVKLAARTFREEPSMDARLRYSRDELLQSHPYVKPHEEAGYRLHGGFVEGGGYVSPRTLVRWPAVRAWGEALQARGWPLIDASRDLLKREGYPTLGQQKPLLRE